MGYGIELVAEYLSDANSTGAQAMAAVAPGSNTVRAAATNATPISLEAIITSFQDVGELRIRSPRLHDDVNALRIVAPATTTAIAALEYFSQLLFSQDALTVEAYFDTAPTATHLSVAGLLVYYSDIPGINGNYQPWASIQPRIKDWLMVPVNPTNGTSAWGTGVAINSTVDVFKANTDYALIGVRAYSSRGLWAISGVDVGNLYVGGAYGVNPVDERRWFPYLEQQTGKPSIPVFNSQNKGATNVYTISDVAAAATFLTLIFADLGPHGQ